ncbi:MAG: prolyl oligopeptidase family serine peptidase [Pseudomonadota bacterium]
MKAYIDRTGFLSARTIKTKPAAAPAVALAHPNDNAFAPVGLVFGLWKTFVVIFGLLAATLVLAPLAAAETTASQQRPMEVDDLFEVQSLAREFGGAVTLSPDGQSAAFSWSRPYREHSSYSYMTVRTDSDVWVQIKPDEKAINITQGGKDKTSWWGAVWSPDGKRLALLSTRGGDGVQLLRGSGVVWVWNKETEELRQITTRKADQLLVRNTDRNLLWLDNRRLLVPLQSAAPPSPYRELPEAQRILVDHWTKSVKGDEATAHVLDSGVPWTPPEQPRSQLMLVDTMSGTSQLIIDDEAHGWSAAPGGKAVAYYRQIGAYAPTAENKLRPDDRSELFGLRIVDLKGDPLFADDAALADVVSETLRWSVDGSAFAFAERPKAGERPRILRGSIATRQITSLKLDNLDVSPPAHDHHQRIEIRWTQMSDVLVRARLMEADDPALKDRYDWWLVSVAAPPRNLTQALPEAPKDLWLAAGPSSFVGFSAGDIWRIKPSGETRNLTASLEGKADMLAWPQTSYKATTEMSAPDRVYSKFVLAKRKPRHALDYSVFDLTSGAIAPLAKPDQEAELASFNPSGDAAVFYANGRERGARLWRATPSSGKTQVLIRANRFLRDIAESEFRLIEYRSLVGQMLNGWVLLPAGYQEGRRYPLLTWVYPGSFISKNADAPSPLHRIGGTSAYNMQLAAAQGFAVLLPSMPLGPHNASDDPLLRLTEGVLPAVDKAIELGIVDENRLFVAGHSFGGYATFGLVTQTDRFEAAIAFSGTANLVNTYGTLIPWMRYTDAANSMLTMNMGWAETGQGRMGNPPWKDLDRYIRNSPITYVDQVDTPLLIVHGDMDFLGMEDPENFFRSLYRQGKRVQFVRYLGEGHILGSPANIRDLWRRMIGWMDEHGDIKRNAQGEMVFENGRVATASVEGEGQP